MELIRKNGDILRQDSDQNRSEINIIQRRGQTRRTVKNKTKLIPDFNY